MSNNKSENISDNINKVVWKYILDSLDISTEQYWYMRGMLDVVIPDKCSLPFVFPLVNYLYDLLNSRKDN